ncbi:hypothetical protein, partial [Nocardia carnea]|uniref:hypothetical protein n=1 Tax=Nocardia carnea TaxID=37328 RepID=UPI0024577850
MPRAGWGGRQRPGTAYSLATQALVQLDELVPPGDAELDGQRAEELAGRFATVRPFLPRLMRGLAFG